MYKDDIDICRLEDLDKLRSAPQLNKKQSRLLLKEVIQTIHKSDWLTIGVMSPSLDKGINAIRRIEKTFEYKEMKLISVPSSDGPIFLKANQKTGEIYARNENGLGEGILITCQNYDNSQFSKTIGPFPLEFFG